MPNLFVVLVAILLGILVGHVAGERDGYNGGPGLGLVLVIAYLAAVVWVVFATAG